MLRPPTQQVALFSHKSQQKRGVVRLPFWALPLGLAGALPPSLRPAAIWPWHSRWQGAELLSVPSGLEGQSRGRCGSSMT